MKPPKGIAGIEFNSIFFTEAAIPSATSIKRLTVVIREQNSNLEDVKLELSNQAKAAGANAIMNFRYGQRLASWREAILKFQWELESWYGEGDAVNL